MTMNTNTATITVTVTGYSYGHGRHGELINFKEGAFYRHLRVRSQFGWEDGCRERDHRTLENIICISHSPGNASCTGTTVFVPEEFAATSRRGNPVVCWFETGSMSWTLDEKVPGYDVPQRQTHIPAAKIGRFVLVDESFVRAAQTEHRPVEENDDIDDFGQGCCPNGRMRHHGGSRYYCDWCGKDKMRAMDLIPCPPAEI